MLRGPGQPRRGRSRPGTFFYRPTSEKSSGCLTILTMTTIPCSPVNFAVNYSKNVDVFLSLLRKLRQKCQRCFHHFDIKYDVLMFLP